MQQRVLFIDDDPNVLEGLRRILHPLSNEWELTFTTNSHEALELVERIPFDIVVTDIMMPEPDGLEVLMALRRRFPAVKVVVMSGGGRWGTFNFLHIAKKLGASSILSKPFSPQALIEAVRGVALRREALAAPGVAYAGTQS